MKLREVGEDRLLAQLLPSLAKGKGVVAAAGDDCAVVRPPRAGRLLLLKTDCIVETIHFGVRDDAAAVGWKAMMRPLSDFAASGGVPQFALITLIIPGERTISWVKKLYQGLRRAAARFDVAIVGGETSSTSGPIAIAVSLAGYVETKRRISRRGGKSGDDLFVTGRLGGSLRQQNLRFLPRIPEARWLTEHFKVHAMMDLSDGLGADLPRLARASQVGYTVDLESLPLNRGCTIHDAVSDGEDYELLFAISPRDRKRLQEEWKRKFPKVPLSRIGRLKPKSAGPESRLPRGYVHFQ